MNKQYNISFANKPAAIGGPSTFIRKLEKFLIENDYSVSFGKISVHTKTLLITSATKRIDLLLYCKYKKIKIVMRLDGLWYFSLRRSGSLKRFIYYKLVNLLMAFIRNYVADTIIYQSKFVEEWWNKSYGLVNKDSKVIYNGNYIPNLEIKKNISATAIKVVCIEGNLVADKITIKLIETMILNLKLNRLPKIYIYGNANDDLKRYFANEGHSKFMGHVNKSELESVRNKKIIHLALDVNSACPNSIIESMSCGIPIIGLNTGSLEELIKDSGILVDVIGDHFKYDIEFDCNQFADAINKLISNYDSFSSNAMRRAKDVFSLDSMGKKYLEVL